MVLSENQYDALCNTGGCDPVPLSAESAKLKSFVYDRAVGVIQCPFGKHPTIMSLLLAWHHGCANGIDVAELLGLQYSSGTADRFLASKGTAFRSSLSEQVEAWQPAHLEEWELAYFGPVRFIG